MRSLLVLLLILASAADGQVYFARKATAGGGGTFAFDQFVSGTVNGGTYLDINITIPTGCNEILVFASFSSQWAAMDTCRLIGQTIGTKLADYGIGGGGTSFELYEIKGTLPTGAQTIRTKWSSTGSAVVNVIALSFKYANSTTPSKSVTTGGGTVSSVSQTVTCNTGDIMVGFTQTAYRTITGTGGTTVLNGGSYISADGYYYGYACTETAGASDKTISWNLSSSNPEIHAVLAVQP